MSSSPLDHKLKIDTEEAQKRAIKNVARMLQRPDQLEKVDQFHKEFERKRMGNESRLKTAVQSQLEGVKTGIEQLSLALRNVREVKTRMRSVFKKIRRHTIHRAFFENYSKPSGEFNELSIPRQAHQRNKRNIRRTQTARCCHGKSETNFHCSRIDR